MFVAATLFALQLVPTPASAQCGELTWVEAIQQGLEANQALVAARETLTAQQKDVAIARAAMLPVVAFGMLGQFSKDRTFSSSAGVIPERVLKTGGGIEQTLYDQQAIDALGAQKYFFESNRYSFDDTRNQTIAAVGQDYIGVLLALALLALQHENVALSEASLEISESQESAGEVPYSNVLRMKSQLYGAKQQLVAQKASVLQSRFAFNQVRNRPSEEVCALQPLALESDGFIFSSEAIVDALIDERGATLTRDYLVELGIERSPLIQSLDAQVRAERRQMKSARRWLIPSFTATAAGAVFLKTDGDGSQMTQDNEFFWQVGLGLEWDVLNGGAFIASMNQSKHQFFSLQWRRDSAATTLEQNIRETAATAMASHERIGLADLQAETANENYALVNEAYLDGESTLLDLIDAQDQVISSNTAARQALYQFFSDLLILEQSIAYYPFLEQDEPAKLRELESRLRAQQ